MSKIQIVSCPDWDWEGLYIDGKLVDQTTIIEVEHLAEFVPNISIHEISEEDIPENTENNGLPKNLSDIEDKISPLVE